jgi:hypothetical protein
MGVETAVISTLDSIVEAIQVSTVEAILGSTVDIAVEATLATSMDATLVEQGQPRHLAITALSILESKTLTVTKHIC